MPMSLAAALCLITFTVAQPTAPTPPTPPTPPTAPPAVAPLTDLDVSPFEAIEWDGESIARVKVAGEWFEWLEINSWKVGELLKFARERYGEKWTKRVEEDLPQLLIDAGRPPKAKVTLRLRMQIDSRELYVDVEMTKANRRAMRDARRDREKAAEPVRERDTVFAEDAELGAAALREFRDLIATRHSYSIATPEGARLLAIVDDVLNRPEKPTLELARLTIERALGVSRDGHARVTSSGPDFGEVFAPCLFVPLGDEPGTGIVAIKPDRTGMLDPARPFVLAINGEEIETRLKRVSERVAHGSPALVRERSCRELRSLGVIALPQATLVLSSAPAGGTNTVEWTAQGVNSPARCGEWPRRESGALEGGSIGYIRLAQMSDDPQQLERLSKLLGRFQKATGLIIDVRGNGGGSRDALMTLASECMAANAPPIVFNAARPLTLGEPIERVDGRMATRFLFRADSPALDDSERGAIARFTPGFKPDAPSVDLDAPSGAFGAWYYGVLRPFPNSPPDGRRVVVLMDNVCFSATDVFLAAMKQIDGVTLVGRPSAGGSGMATTYPLAGGALSVSLSTMVSFQPDGRLFDSVGVQPDVVVKPQPTDFVTGGTDTALDAAVRLLNVK